METLLKEYLEDVDSAIKLLELNQQLYETRKPDKTTNEDNFSHIEKLLDAIVESRSRLNVLSGTLLLYLCGRFEYFVRNVFEDLCNSIAAKCNCFDDLPKPIRESLIHWTAEVMQQPRKFGHAEGGVTTFVKNLYTNLHAINGVGDINYQCLSITMENLKSEPFLELFKRANYKRIWEDIGQQANMRSFFRVEDSNHASSLAKSKLDSIMNMRNSIAHPSASVNWPAPDAVLEFCYFFKQLTISVHQLCQAKASSFSIETN